MTGQTIQSRNVNYHDVEGSILPNGAWSDTGLEGLFLLTGSLSRAVRNRAHMKPDAVLGGALPAIGANFLTFTGNASWLQTQIPDSPEMTLIAAAKWSNTANATAIMTSYKGTSPAHPSVTANGAQLIAGSASSNCICSASYWTGSADPDYFTSTASAGFNIFNFHVGRLGAVGVSCKNMTTTAFTSALSPPGARDPSPNLMRIGAASNADYLNSVDIALVMMFSRQLADAELPPLYAQLQLYLASQGVTV